MARAAERPSITERIKWDTRIKPLLVITAVAAVAYLVALYMIAPRMDAARADYLPESFLNLPLGHVLIEAGDTGALLPVRMAETSSQRSVGFRDVGEAAMDNQFLLYAPTRATTSRTSYSVRDVRVPVELLVFDAEGIAIASYVSQVGATSVSVPEPHRWALAAEAGAIERLGLGIGATLDPESIVKH